MSHRAIDWASLGGEWDEGSECSVCSAPPTGIRPHPTTEGQRPICPSCLLGEMENNASHPASFFAGEVAAYRREMAAADEWESKHGRGCDDVEARERKAKAERDWYSR